MTTSIDELLALVDQRPQQALDSAAALLAGEPEPRHAAQLLWITGLAQRELGHLMASRTALEDARALALAIDDRPLAARVAISLAYEIGHAGDLPRALELLGMIEADVDDADRRPAAPTSVASSTTGSASSTPPSPISTRHGSRPRSPATSARSCGPCSTWGDQQPASRPRAGANRPRGGDRARLPARSGRDGGRRPGEPRLHRDDRGQPPGGPRRLRRRRGRLPAGGQRRRPPAVARQPRHGAAPTPTSSATPSALIEEALRLAAATDNDVETAELLMLSAEIHLARGDATSARDAAVDAHERFRRQGRDSWLHVATRARLRAQARLAPGADDVARDLVANARDLAAGGWRSEALAAMLLAALLDAEAGRTDRVTETLAAIGPPSGAWPCDRSPRPRPRARPDVPSGGETALRRVVPSPVACAPRPPPRPRWGRWRRGRTPPTTAPPSSRSGRAWPWTIAGRGSCSTGSRRCARWCGTPRWCGRPTRRWRRSWPACGR